MLSKYCPEVIYQAFMLLKDGRESDTSGIPESELWPAYAALVESDQGICDDLNHDAETKQYFAVILDAQTTAEAVRLFERHLYDFCDAIRKKAHTLDEVLEMYFDEIKRDYERYAEDYEEIPALLRRQAE